MKEKVRFVWETRITTDLREARKCREYADMKEIYENMKRTLNALRHIRELSELAKEFGVLQVTIGSPYYDFYFMDGELIIQRAVIRKLFSDEVTEDTSNVELETKFSERWKEVLDRAVEYQEQELEKMKGFLKEAERYLTVSVEP